MFKLNGSQQQHPQTQKPVVLKTRGNRLRTWLLDLPQSVRVVSLLIVLGLVLLLVGCATTSTPSSEPAKNPSLPPTTLSESSETFLSNASANIQAWRKRLTELLPK